MSYTDSIQALRNMVSAVTSGGKYCLICGDTPDGQHKPSCPVPKAQEVLKSTPSNKVLEIS